MARYFFVFAACFWFISVLPAKAQLDSATIDVESMQIEQNFDSLMHVWYVKKAVQYKDEDVYYMDTLAVNLPDSVYIARLKKLNSMVPLAYNEKVRDWINLYGKKKKYLEAILGLSTYYNPMFEEILDSYQVPLELRFLPVIESALNPRAQSRAGAVGLWQFMYGTGRMYGLNVTSYLDERRDPVAATHAAARYLADLYTIYQDWTLVIAAYNCGPGNVNKAIRRSNGKRSYWEIYPYLPRETRGYVPAFIAATYFMSYYKEHQLKPTEITLPVATDTIMVVNQQLHLNSIATILGLPLDMLRDMNPQYRKDIIPAYEGGYPLMLPITHTSAFIDLQDSIYRTNDAMYASGVAVYETAPEYKGTKYSSGSNSYSSSSSSSNYYEDYTPPSTENKAKVMYTVKSGDVISVIAKWYDVKLADLKYWNNMNGNRINIGQQLVVYVPIKYADKYKNINNMTLAQKNEAFAGVTSQSNSNSTTANTGSKTLDNSFVYYTIRSGDNIWDIAKKFPGVTDKDIMKINGFTSSSLQKLQPGDVIKIKRKDL